VNKKPTNTRGARYAEYGAPLIVRKVPEFEFSPSEVGAMMDKVRRHTALILHLRGNPGGSVETLCLARCSTKM
jgi:hypothetical protein